MFVDFGCSCFPREVLGRPRGAKKKFKGLFVESCEESGDDAKFCIALFVIRVNYVMEMNDIERQKM